MMSVGCGTGGRERKFASHPEFSLIRGIDIAGKLVEEAKYLAKEAGHKKIQYRKTDFRHYYPDNESYDLILFNSSLHHFKDINSLTEQKIIPLLKEDGLLVIFEYTGPDRLQWTRTQLDFANKMLRRLPPRYRLRNIGKSLKKQVYRPGLLRMILSDPSEAVDSTSIIPALHKHFKMIEEKKVGGNILHLLFKGIAHNFLDNSIETEALLKYLFRKEDEFLNVDNTSDLTFGIYQKK